MYPSKHKHYSEYGRLLLDARRREFAPAVAAIRRGLRTVVPPALLSLLSWHELQVSVFVVVFFRVCLFALDRHLWSVENGIFIANATPTCCTSFTNTMLNTQQHFSVCSRH
jgi:hypothetical protein